MKAELENLYTDCKPRFIHRDVKSSNIVLDENVVAKDAEFGISKQAPEGQFSGIDTLLKGTPGYFDPEYELQKLPVHRSND
jgi:serine/threonine protein kinase